MLLAIRQKPTPIVCTGYVWRRVALLSEQIDCCTDNRVQGPGPSPQIQRDQRSESRGARLSVSPQVIKEFLLRATAMMHAPGDQANEAVPMIPTPPSKPTLLSPISVAIQLWLHATTKPPASYHSPYHSPSSDLHPRPLASQSISQAHKAPYPQVTAPHRHRT